MKERVMNVITQGMEDFYIPHDYKSEKMQTWANILKQGNHIVPKKEETVNIIHHSP